jgi:hypothetical protein
MNWEQWLAHNKMNIELGESSIDLMRRAYVAGLRQAFDLLDNAPPEDFHWCRHEIKKLIESSK